MAVSIAGALLSTGALASYKITSEVVISSTTTGMTAMGSMGSARSSADSNQYIGCQVSTNNVSSRRNYGPGPPRPSPLQLEVRQQVDRLIDSTRLSWQWGLSQAEEFRQLLSQLTAAQRQEVTHRLIVLLISGQVDVQTGGAPF